MVSKKIKIFIATWLLFSASTAFAVEVLDDKVTNLTITTTTETGETITINKPVTVMRLQLTAQEWQNFLSFNLWQSLRNAGSKLANKASQVTSAIFAKAYASASSANNSDTHSPMDAAPGPLPSHVDLGMANVPVLDQGIHGTCVTFATTAVLDAAMNRGDYISQLCTLAMVKHLSQTGQARRNPWHGTLASDLLPHVFKHGVVSKSKEYNANCGGLRSYPSYDMYTESEGMNPVLYLQYSEKLIPNLSYKQWLSSRFADKLYDLDKAKQILLQVKQALASGKTRLTFGVRLFSNCNGNGNCASYHQRYDTWALTAEIDLESKKSSEFSSHHMVIIGYDDDAQVRDREGKIHQGILILRNSWGSNAGDHGNYYMTYDYFMQFVWQLYAFTQA